MHRLIILSLTSLLLSACASTAITSISTLQSINDGFSVPYRISDAGHFLIDVSVNENVPRPFILDTGANVSAIYEPAAKALGLVASDKMIAVNGLVGSGLRPVLDGIELGIGPETYEPDNAVF